MTWNVLHTVVTVQAVVQIVLCVLLLPGVGNGGRRWTRTRMYAAILTAVNMAVLFKLWADAVRYYEGW